MNFEEKIEKAITNKAFDRCIGCKKQAVREIKEAAEEEIKNRSDQAYKDGYNQRLKDEGKTGEEWQHLYL